MFGNSDSLDHWDDGRSTVIVISQDGHNQAILAGKMDNYNKISIISAKFPHSRTVPDSIATLDVDDNGHITPKDTQKLYTEIAKAEAVASIGKTGGTTVPNRTANNNTMAGNGR